VSQTTLQSVPISVPRRYDSIYNVHFDVVHGCQLRCVGCPNSTLKPKIKTIDPDFFGACLRNIDVQQIHTFRLFNFGEPLLHKQLAECVAQIPRQRWKASIVEISTNAQKVYWDNFEEMMKLQVVNRLVVSCDGDGTPEEYERLRTPSKWENFIEFLERARALRDRWSPATQLVTRTVISDKQWRERWRGVLQPRGWTPEFRGWMNLPEASISPLGRPEQAPEGSCFFMGEPEDFPGNTWNGEITLLYVDMDGTVVPCCLHPKAATLGNLREQTYNEIMNGAARNRFIQTMNADRAGMPICGQCDMGPPGREGPSFESVIGMQD